MYSALVFRFPGLLLIVLAICAGGRVLAQDDAQANKPVSMRLITIEEAKERAINAPGSQGANLAQLAMDAAREHRLAAQADYFPKIGATFYNLHFNKFMGQQIQVLAVGRTLALPLLNKDQTFVAATVTQPVTPLLKVHQAVQIARADERIAEAKAGQKISQVTSDVERLYYSLLIAQRQHAGADARVKLLQSRMQLASTSTPSLAGVDENKVALLEATKAFLTAKSDVTELTQTLNGLIGLPAETELKLAAPLPVDETITLAEATSQAMVNNLAVIEAEQTVAKARAAAKLSKMEYIPDVAILGGYSYQTAIPLLPRDFSFIGVIATYNVFDFGKRERSMQERKMQLAMAEGALEATKAKVASEVQKSFLDLQRSRRVRDLTLQLASQLAATHQVPASYQPASYQKDDWEAVATRAKAEEQMFQAEFDYRLAVVQLKSVIGKK
jgi:outer membrane protein TolC